MKTIEPQIELLYTSDNLLLGRFFGTFPTRFFMAEVKGVLLNAWMLLLKKRYGDEAIAEAIGKLGPEDRHLFSSPFLASSWYSFEALNVLSRLTRLLADPAEKGLAFEIGRFMAEHVYTTVYRSQMADDPIKQVQRYGWINDMLFRDARRQEAEILGQSSCAVRYYYPEVVKPNWGFCISNAGFWSKMLEMAGAPQVRASHTKCMAKGDSCCEFIFEW